MRLLKRRLAGLWFLGTLVIAAACSPSAAIAIKPPAASSLPTSTRPVPPPATVDCGRPEVKPGPLSALCSPGRLPTDRALLALPTAAATPALTPTPVPAAALPTAAPVLTPCAEQACDVAEPPWVKRPIVKPGRDSVDESYRFGSTQGGARDPHHGVELLNRANTPVLAAADGTVVVAGDDRKTFYGPYSYFYGNLVVIAHQFPGLTPTVYTLYGHLSKLSVEAGQQVIAGQEVGRVGMTGIAEGDHLHFEVRYGENSYASSRNPELWLFPHRNAAGKRLAALAGRILDAQGHYLENPNIVLERLPGPGLAPEGRVYLSTYEEKGLRGQPPYFESFAIGDLEPGWYRISFVQYGFQRREVQILPGEIKILTFKLED